MGASLDESQVRDATDYQTQQSAALVPSVARIHPSTAFPSPTLPSHPLSPLPLEVSPLNPARGSWERIWWQQF